MRRTGREAPSRPRAPPRRPAPAPAAAASRPARRRRTQQDADHRLPPGVVPGAQHQRVGARLGVRGGRRPARRGRSGGGVPGWRRPGWAAAAAGRLAATAVAGGCWWAPGGSDIRTSSRRGPGAASSRASDRSRPSSSSDSNSGGETRRPVTATRTGPKALRGLSPSPSTSAARSASSIASVVQSARPPAPPGPRPTTSQPVLVEHLVDVGLVVGRPRRRRGSRACRRPRSACHPLVDQRHRPGQQLGLRPCVRLVGEHARRPAGTAPPAAVMSSTAEHPQVGGVDRLGLLQVEARRVRVDPADVEGRDHLLRARRRRGPRRSPSRAGPGS